MIKCKSFTKTYRDNNSAEFMFNEWSAMNDYEIFDVQSHSNENGEVISIVVFYIVVEKYDICGDCESYVNPPDSSKRII